MNSPRESDWKKYSAMLPMLRERYLAKINARAVAMLTDPKKNETERFWDTMERMEKEAHVLRFCLDRHARSQMVNSMLAMLRYGLMTKDDLAVFSEELQEGLAYVFDAQKGKA